MRAPVRSISCFHHHNAVLVYFSSPSDESLTMNDGPKFTSTPGRTQQHMARFKTAIPEEMYNLFQLAEVSLAASNNSSPSSSSSPSDFHVLDRWHHRQQDLPSPVLDKPLDLSRDNSSSSSSSSTVAAPRIILTPSPSPTPSESHLTISLGLGRKKKQQQLIQQAILSEESNSSSSCCSPDDTASCRSGDDAASKLASSASSDNNSHSGDGHECPDCGKRYSTSSNLARHRQTHRSPADQKVPPTFNSSSSSIIKQLTILNKIYNPGPTLSSLRQSVRFGAGLFHARPDSQPGLQVSLLRQILFEALAPARAHPDPHRYPRL